MKSFKDKEKRDWSIDVNVGSVLRVKALTDVDLTNLTDGKVLSDLQNDPLLIGRVIYALCKPQVEQAGMGDEQFWAAMDGDAVEAAGEALVIELVNFSRKDLRPILTKIRDKGKRLRQQGLGLVSKQVDDPESEKKFLAMLQQQLDESGTSSGPVPASAASTPLPSPSAN